MPNTSTTELEAVNTMLATIGEAPVNSITGTLPLDAALAKTTLDEITREVLASGWHFNMFYDYTLSLDVDSKIPLADNILRVDLDVQKYAPTTYDVVKQGSFLYNKKDNTIKLSVKAADYFKDKCKPIICKKGSIIILPKNATPIDFAYAVHTKIGDTAIACEINGRES